MASETMNKSKEYLEKEDRWEVAMGLASVDGWKPDPFFLNLVEREKRGEITTDDIKAELYREVQDYQQSESGAVYYEQRPLFAK
jgi:hypothetical protein